MANIRFLLILWFFLSSLQPAYGFDILKGIMPGDVSSLHEKVEGKCLECHTLGRKFFFDKCLVCHKETKRDVEQKNGFHGKIDSSRCESCHEEHKGKASQLIQFDTGVFDHHKTRFELDGKHKPAPCKDCHLKPKYRETPHDCISCHVKEDKHKGGLGKSCEKCHNAGTWKEIKFDHGTTTFPLEGKHVPVKCDKCHTPDNFAKTPTTCISCHKKEDKHKGALGEKCERCHSATDWPKIKFDHDKTDFPLEGKHQAVKCEKCHTKENKFKETPKTCIGCHLKEDKHKGILGKKCETCHSAKTWKEPAFDHNKFEFKLISVHQKVDCLKCHKTPQVKETSKVCFDCHKKEDEHKGKAGQDCDRCHLVAEKWKQIKFDHSTTKYPLIGKHIPVSCVKCHAKDEFKVPVACSSCHTKDDKHKGKLGQTCEKCHNERSWKDVKKFDHQKTDFQLEGKHIETKCALCHKTQLFKDTSKICLNCHKKDDYHKGMFGKKCEFCHTAKTWERDDFDHLKETGYALLDKHRGVDCTECHTKALFVKKTSRVCVSCHKPDDIHDGELGFRCEICHSEVGFKVIKKDPRP
ncbi:MAG: cytochrome C [Nitrospirae bacterium]|nr:cytochrome C [Nitrospirota bacterium]MBI3351184.1 cytochrome C [Nitrospirota bacterium]